MSSRRKSFSRGLHHARYAFGILAVVHAARAFALLRTATIFSDHAVLQRDRPVPVWGWASPGSHVRVTFAGQSKSVQADPTGRWSVILDPRPASLVPQDLTIEETDASGRAARSAVIRDVLVGEVWLCAGQSNMEMPLERAEDGPSTAAQANDPHLRWFQVYAAPSREPAPDVRGQWFLCQPESAARFSAVALFFGRELRRVLGVPIGLIHCSKGWTTGEAWMSREALLAEPQLRYLVEVWDRLTEAHPRAQAEYQAAVAQWEKDAAEAAAAGREPPLRPKPPPDPMFLHRPAGFFNSGIAPLAPYPLRGVIWYQGESNETRGYEYRFLLPALIRDWRRHWGHPELPFLWVQVANVLPPDPEPTESEWAELRESQAMALTLPHTGMAVTIDLGEANDVHPRKKREVGERLALLARAQVYGETGLVCCGPLYDRMQIEDGRIRLFFRHVGGGLVCRGDRLRHFAIAGEDRRFVWAEAAIENDTVVVWSPRIPAPVAVRYAWANNPEGCNLYNAEGLPAAPFRTDAWPEKTRESRLRIGDP